MDLERIETLFIDMILDAKQSRQKTRGRLAFELVRPLEKLYQGDAQLVENT